MELNLGDRVLGEVEENSFYYSARQAGDTADSVPLKTVCPDLEGFGEEFYSSGSKAGLLIRIRVCAGPGFRWSDEFL